MICIRKAEYKDLDDIRFIANQNDIRNLKKKEEIANGFMVPESGGFSYEACMKNKHFYVLTENGEVKAFIIAFDYSEIDFNNTVINKVRNRSNIEFSVIKQVCVERNNFRKGFASKLYEYIFQHINNDIYVCSSCYRPIQ